MSWDPLTLPVDPPLHSISTHVWSRTHNLSSNKNIVCVGRGGGGGAKRRRWAKSDFISFLFNKLKLAWLDDAG